MGAVVIAVALLVLAASFGSWCLSQWLGARQRASNALLAMGGAGVALLIGAAALTFIVAPTSWYAVLRTVGFEADAPSGRVSPDFRASSRDEESASDAKVAPPSSRRRSTEGLQDTPRGRRYRDYPDETAQSVAASTLTASQRVTETPDVPPEIGFILAEHWPATECVKSLRSAGSDRWLLDNECAGVVAIVFAWCPYSGPICDPNAPNSAAWRYEPAGILMTTLRERPSTRRLAERGPLVAPTYALRETEDPPQVRYFACNVTNSDLLSLLNEPSEAAGEREQGKFDAALRADECYAWVAKLSQTGARTGRSPDMLLQPAGRK